MESSDLHDLASRAEELYEGQLRAILEPGHRGEFIAIEPDSGNYFVGRKLVEAIEAAHAAFPDRLTYTRRIGFPTAVEVG